jgi:hypothetical protein
MHKSPTNEHPAVVWRLPVSPAAWRRRSDPARPGLPEGPETLTNRPVRRGAQRTRRRHLAPVTPRHETATPPPRQHDETRNEPAPPTDRTRHATRTPKRNTPRTPRTHGDRASAAPRGSLFKSSTSGGVGRDSAWDAVQRWRTTRTGRAEPVPGGKQLPGNGYEDPQLSQNGGFAPANGPADLLG